MKKYRFKRFGPFSYFRINKGRKNFVSAWLRGDPDAPFGWEWGSDDNPSNPALCIRVWHFNMLAYESFASGGFTLWVLGFWWMK